tara:strand:- start:458 stop:607 length:150 start_codon:yes stop_codon:yes gene_type:complete
MKTNVARAWHRYNARPALTVGRVLRLAGIAWALFTVGYLGLICWAFHAP